MVIDALQLVHPIPAFNGGVLVNPDLSVFRQYFLVPEFAGRVIDMSAKHGLDVWLYTDRVWYVHQRHGPHVDREEWTVKFPPIVIASYDDLLTRAVKIVGVGDDYVEPGYSLLDQISLYEQKIEIMTGKQSLTAWMPSHLGDVIPH